MKTSDVRKKNLRTKAHYKFGSDVADLIKSVFPNRAGFRDTIAATCIFEIRGKRANGNMYGIGFLTRAKTYGEIPVGCVSHGHRIARCFPCQVKGNWIELTDNDAANIILACFGLTDKDVLLHFGRPAEGERYSVSLMEVVKALAPETISNYQAAISETVTV